MFGEGCFKSAADYSAAAPIYQHGNVPDHFFQPFLWAKRAVDLGESSQKLLTAKGIDHYLVNIGHKQLFATQGSKPSLQACWCLEEVEKSFPETRSIELTQRSLTEAMSFVGSLNDHRADCVPSKFCIKSLKDTLVDTVPGFW